MTVLASDSFNRADSTNLGNTDSYAGGSAFTWVKGSGTTPTQILSAVLSLGDGPSEIYVASGVVDAKLTCDVTCAHDYNAGLILRYADASNMLVGAIYNSAGVAPNGLVIIKIASGVPSFIAQDLTCSSVSGFSTMVFEVSGNSYTLTYNGHTVTATDSFNSTVKNHGIRGYANGPANTAKNFILEGASSPSLILPGSDMAGGFTPVMAGGF